MLARQKIDGGMKRYIAQRALKLIIPSKISANGGALIFGCTSKEDVPDIRNTKFVDIISELAEYDISVSCVDTKADPSKMHA